MSQLSALFIHADRLRSAGESLETVMARMDRKPAHENLSKDLDDAMQEVMSAKRHCERLAALINEARAAQRGYDGPSGTACDVVPSARVVTFGSVATIQPAPLGDEFDAPRAPYDGIRQRFLPDALA